MYAQLAHFNSKYNNICNDILDEVYEIYIQPKKSIRNKSIINVLNSCLFNETESFESTPLTC